MRNIKKERGNPCRAENDLVEMVLANFWKTTAPVSNLLIPRRHLNAYIKLIALACFIFHKYTKQQ